MGPGKRFWVLQYTYWKKVSNSGINSGKMHMLHAHVKHVHGLLRLAYAVCMRIRIVYLTLYNKGDLNAVVRTHILIAYSSWCGC